MILKLNVVSATDFDYTGGSDMFENLRMRGKDEERRVLPEPASGTTTGLHETDSDSDFEGLTDLVPLHIPSQIMTDLGESKFGLPPYVQQVDGLPDIVPFLIPSVPTWDRSWRQRP
eukprot:gene8991-16129_t